jgi:hypothetical protein
MDRNVGNTDRIVRIVAGLLLAVAGVAAVAGYWAAGLTIGLLGLAVGAILLVTGTTQRCPIDAGAGISTAEERH